MSAASDFLTDPVGVIGAVIADADDSVDAETIARVVAAVAPGRNVQRKLARALDSRPELLRDGRSPAPRVAGTLLLALRDAGAMRISAPRCAGCSRTLRTLQRRGEDWYCNTCGPRPRPCSSCGQERVVATLDRQGQPRCSRCPDHDERDPLQLLTDLVVGLEPTLSRHTIADAIGRVFTRRGNVQHLAWVIEDSPALLTGQGAHAPTPAVLRLIDNLCDAGAKVITRPACTRCDRIVRLHRRIDGLWVCRNCLAKSRAQPCSRCGAIREIGSRDEHGNPLCPHCVSTDPANQEVCLGCRRRRPVNTRTPDGPLCGTCTPRATMTCSICGRTRPAVISTATGQPWCRACGHRRARCTQCGNVRPVRGGTHDEPLCATCVRPDAFWHACPGCGEPTANRRRRCARCTLHRRLDQLIRDSDGAVHPQLQALRHHLASHDRPDTVLAWLSKDTAAATLREIAADRRTISHAMLDELPDDKPLRHLRAMLVATNALPPRDEHLARLDQWIHSTVAERDDPDQRTLLHRYATWHLLHRLRCRNNARHATHGQTSSVQQHVRAAIAVLDWLATEHFELNTVGQGDLEAWLVSPQASHRNEAGHFIRWANRNKLTSLEFAATRWDGPTQALDTEQRWAKARTLLNDNTIEPADRVAGLLVLLYAQRAATISRLTLDHVDDDGRQVRLRLGHQPVLLPDPLAALVRQLVTIRHGHATLGDQGRSRWLFPGGRPNQPISADHLAERLRQRDLYSGPARSAALFSLAAELPAALLAQLLGVHIKVAVAWQRASNGDWSTYAADYSRRPAGRLSGTPKRSF